MKKNIIKTIVAFIVLSIFFVITKTNVNAQNAISLSITPPLLEVLVKPGKEVRQVYSITNNGGDTTLIAKMLYFEPSDESGNVDITNDEAPDWVRYSKEPFKIKNGDKVDFSVLITPDTDIPETDHFLTLLFETAAPTDVLSQNSSFYQTQIGSNILITVSKDGNPKKSAQIVEFSAPIFVDSILGQINYVVTLKNNGNSFWKPIGKIMADSETIKLAPQNILSGSNRNILCLQDENLINCRLQNNFHIGKIISRLEFLTDDSPTVYKQEVVTYALPVSGIIAFLIFLGIMRIYARRQRFYSKHKNL